MDGFVVNRLLAFPPLIKQPLLLLTLLAAHVAVEAAAGGADHLSRCEVCVGVWGRGVEGGGGCVEECV